MLPEDEDAPNIKAIKEKLSYLLDVTKGLKEGPNLEYNINRVDSGITFPHKKSLILT